MTKPPAGGGFGNREGLREGTMTNPTNQAVYILFTPQSITLDATTALIDQVQTLIGEGLPTINLLISSPGGNVYAGLLAYNFLKGCPAEIVTHNINTCDSIAGVIYAAGDRRLSVPHGRFLLHGPRVGFTAITGGLGLGHDGGAA